MKRSWEKKLIQSLQRLQPPDRPVRVAIVGIGHELRGDDAAGLAVARALHAPAAAPPASPVLVIEAGPAPENYTGQLRRFGPDLVLLVDAARMDEAAGAVRWLDWPATTGLGASTHTLPPHILARYLVAELECEVAVLGIQPETTIIGATLSATVEQAVNKLAHTLARLLLF